MTNKNRIVLIAVLLALSAAVSLPFKASGQAAAQQATATQRPIELADSLAWRRIASPSVSPDGQWFTPAGVALGEIDCISPAPLAGATGREICKARLIGDTPGAIAECRRQGGTTGPVSVADARFACTYPKTTPNADGGSDGQGRSPNFTGTKT